MKKIKKYQKGEQVGNDIQKLFDNKGKNVKQGEPLKSFDPKRAGSGSSPLRESFDPKRGIDPGMSRNFGEHNSYKDRPMGKVRISSEPKNNDPGMSRPPYKKGGPITSMDQVQRMYSKKKK